MSATIVLAVIGAFNVFATTQQRLINQGFNPYFYVTRQVTFLIIAAVVLTLVMAVGHDWLRSKSVILYVAVVMSLALLFIAGQVTGGARLSFDLGIIAVQPAEIAKSVVIIFLAWVVVGVVMWRGYHRLAMGGAVAAMLATLLMLREHATDVIGLCL